MVAVACRLKIGYRMGFVMAAAEYLPADVDVGSAATAGGP